MRLLRKAKILVKKSRKARVRRATFASVRQRTPPPLPRFILQNIHHPVLRMAWAAELHSTSAIQGHLAY